MKITAQQILEILDRALHGDKPSESAALMAAWKSRNEPQATIAETNAEINRCRVALGMKERAPIFNAKTAHKELDGLKAMLTAKGLAVPPAALKAVEAIPAVVVAPVIEKLAEVAPIAAAVVVEKLFLDQQCKNRRDGKSLSPEIESLTVEIAEAKPGLRRDCLQRKLDELTAPKKAEIASGGAATIAALELQIESTPAGLTRDCLQKRLDNLKK